MRNYQVAVIGGGPIGLYAASLLEKEHVVYHLFEAEENYGGQPLSLYPEKEVVDVSCFPAGPSKKIIEGLLSRLDESNLSNLSPIKSLEEKDDGVYLSFNNETIKADYLILATGLGFHKPRTMGLENEEKCSNILYSIKDFSILKGKRVAIFGGGDSALDWAKEISKISDHVSLIHRRTEWRGNPDTIKGCKLDIYLPYIPYSLTEKDGFCKEITIKNVTDETLKNLDVDYVLVNYGQVPSPSTFFLKLTDKGFGVLADERHLASKRIYAAGDCLYYENKKKRIEPGFEEVDVIVSDLLKRL